MKRKDKKYFVIIECPSCEHRIWLDKQRVSLLFSGSVVKDVWSRVTIKIPNPHSQLYKAHSNKLQFYIRRRRSWLRGTTERCDNIYHCQCHRSLRLKEIYLWGGNPSWWEKMDIPCCHQERLENSREKILAVSFLLILLLTNLAISSALCGPPWCLAEVSVIRNTVYIYDLLFWLLSFSTIFKQGEEKKILKFW